MADTQRSIADLLVLLADNTSGQISPQDLRDMLVSVHGVYGALLVFEAAIAQTGIGTTPVKLTAFDTNGNASGTTPDHTNDQITVLINGTYNIQFSASFSGTNSAEVRFRLRVNAIEQPYGAVRKLGTGGDIGSCAFFAPDITLVANDIVTIYVESDGAGDEVTIEEASLSMFMIG